MSVSVSHDVHRGQLLAGLLAGSWRPDPPACSLTEKELELILVLILESRTTGLAWRAIRGTSLATTAAGRTLRHARLIMAARAAVRNSQIERLLSQPGIRDSDPFLVKGWAHAQLFPEPALRPYSDIDLFILPDRREEALAAYQAVARADPEPLPIDLQTVWRDLPDRTHEEILARSCVVPLGSSRVHILGPEDALRLTCLHFLRHLGSNPVWLCDVAVMLENLPQGFDWGYCLAGDGRRTDWMVAIIRLANQLLGASASRCPADRLPLTVPGWMVKAVLRIWGHGNKYIHPRPMPAAISTAVGYDVRRLPGALAQRWPNPLESVLNLSWPINRVTGRSAQVLEYGLRAVTWFSRQFRTDGHSHGDAATGLACG